MDSASVGKQGNIMEATEITLSLSTLIVFGAHILLALVVPFLFYFFFSKKCGCSGRVFFAGCSAMVAFGVVVPMIFNFVLWPTEVGQYICEKPWLYGLVMALVAGLIHEPGRYLCAKYFLDDEVWDDYNAIMFGLGYGSVALLSSAITSALGNFLMAMTIVNGQIGDYLGSMSGEELEAVTTSLIVLCATPLEEYIMLIVEPLIMTVSHVALSVLVWYAVQGGKKAWHYLLLAMALNFVLEYAMVVGANYAGDGMTLQVLRALLTAGVAYVAVQVWKKEYKPVALDVE